MRHRQLRHGFGDTGQALQFVCPVVGCGKVFLADTSLYRHKRTVHLLGRKMLRPF